MKIYYGKAIYNNKEISAAIKVLKRNNLNLVDGPSVKNFEKKVVKLFGKKYGLMVNSGSSANLLGLASFNFKKGSEVITPSLTFSTTISPIYQLGLVPHFIDVEENKFIGYLGEKCRNLSSAQSTNSCIFIGPEGDFTSSEIKYAEEKGFEIVSLGDRRLRTETAGIVSCMILNGNE